MGKKRGQNEGSIFQRKDGRWVGQVSVDGRLVSKYFKTQREAREWVRHISNQKEQGLTYSGVRLTISRYMKTWLEAIKTSVRPRTHQQYSQITRDYIIPDLGSLKLSELRPDQIQYLYNSKQKEGVGVRTIQLIHAVLHSALNQAVKMGLVSKNPCDAVIKPKISKKEMNVWNDNQVRSFLQVTTGTRYEALFHIAVTTGLRLGEILGLKWSDLEWKSGRLSVQRQLQRNPEGGLIFCEPKSEAGKRVIIIGLQSRKLLQQHLRILDLERKEAGDRWKENGLLFPSKIGSPMDPRNLERVFKEYLKKAKLEKIRFHDLRHTAATLMLQQDIHPKVVQERLGHSHISMTLDTYSHVLPSLQVEAAEKMDELMSVIEISDEFAIIKNS